MRGQSVEGFINDAGDANDGNGDDRLTQLIIFCAFTVASGLGVGFVEKVYANALAYKLRPAGLHIDQQRAVEVRFDGQVVDTDVADLIVHNAVVVVDLQAVNALTTIHAAQDLNCPKKIRGLPTCPLLNFGTLHLQVLRLSRPT